MAILQPVATRIDWSFGCANRDALSGSRQYGNLTDKSGGYLVAKEAVF